MQVCNINEINMYAHIFIHVHIFSWRGPWSNKIHPSFMLLEIEVWQGLFWNSHSLVYLDNSHGFFHAIPSITLSGSFLWHSPDWIRSLFLSSLGLLLSEYLLPCLYYPFASLISHHCVLASFNFSHSANTERMLIRFCSTYVWKCMKERIEWNAGEKTKALILMKSLFRFAL